MKLKFTGALYAAITTTSIIGWSQPTLAQEPVSLRVWLLSTPKIEEFVAATTESFRAKHQDIDVVVELQQNEAYKTGLQVALVGSDPPDVFFNWSGDDAQRLIADGLALDVTDLAKGEGQFAEEISPGWLGSFSKGDRLFGAPTNAVSKYFYYSKAFFSEHKLKVPNTFGQILQLCRDIRAIDPAIVPLPLGNSERWKMNHYITLINERVLGNEALRADYNLTAPDDQLFANPGYVTAWEKVLELQKAGCFQDAPNATSPEVSRSMFSSQLSPMIFCGTWCAGIFDTEGFTDYAMFRFPVIEDGASDGNSNMVVPEGLQISAKTQHPKEAVEWVTHMVSPEVSKLRAEILGQIPSNTKELGQAKGTEQFKWMADDVASLAVQFNVIDVEVEASVANAYLDAGTEILNGTMTPAQAMVSIRTAALAAKAAKAGK